MRTLASILILSASLWAQARGQALPIMGSTWNGGSGGGSITVTDTGGTVQASGHTCTISSVTLTTGDTITAVGVTPGLAGTLTATWNGNSMTEAITALGSSGLEAHVFKSDNVTGATGNIVLTKSNSGDDGVAFNCASAKVSGLSTKAMDKTASNSSLVTSQSTWDTGTTATTTAANEGMVAYLMCNCDLTETFGTWQNSFTRLNTRGQASGGGFSIDYGSRVVSATGTYIGQTTGNSPIKNFIGYIMTFK